jgi:hypothetical protein
MRKSCEARPVRRDHRGDPGGDRRGGGQVPLPRDGPGAPRCPREEAGPGRLAVAAARARHRLPGAGRLRPPRSADALPCRRGGDLLRGRGDRAPAALLRARGLYVQPAMFNPLPCLALLERKLGALGQAAPLAGWDLPEAFATPRRRPGGSTRWIHRGPAWASAASAGSSRSCGCSRRSAPGTCWPAFGRPLPVARLCGATGCDAVKHLVLCRITHRPPRLDPGRRRGRL